MAPGKFSNPRPHRDEERQIEQAFRQVTGQEPIPQPAAVQMDEDAQIVQTIQQIRQQPQPKVSPRPSVPPKKPERYDLLPEDVDAFFDAEAPDFDEAPIPTEPDFVDNMMAFFQKAVSYCEKNQKIVMTGACIGALLIIVSFIGLFFAGNGSPADPNDGKILNNVIIADINVGGLTKNEAVNAVKLATSSTYTAQDMVIDLSGVELRLSPKDTKAELDVKAAVNAAYDYGRTGTKAEQEKALADSLTQQHTIGLLPYLKLNTTYIKETLAAYATESGSTLTQATYGLEGKQPELSAEKFNENAPTQTLVITLGTPGIGFDVNSVYDQVLDAYSLHVFLVEVENVEATKDPDPVDLEAIYKEFYIEPVNATVNLQNFKTESGSYGYGFDLKEAQKLIDKAAFGEEVRIPMEYIAPEILNADSFFKDTLGEYRTRTTGNDDRNKNLSLACQAINGTVLDPGESLVFSTVLSKVSGFRVAPEDTGREETHMGGASQVSSTLYYAALLSDLSVQSRSNLEFVPSFVDPGLDAATSLKIANSTGFPIRIEAEVSGGYVKVKIIGTEERAHSIGLDYSIANTYSPETRYEDFAWDNEEGYRDGDVIEEGTTGYLVKSYKVKYSTESGKEISRDFIANSQYPAEDKVIARVEPEPTTEPTAEATEPEETVKPTKPKPVETQPVETTPPETTAPTVPQETTPPVTQAPTEPPVTEPPATAPATEPPAAEVPHQEEAAGADTAAATAPAL